MITVYTKKTCLFCNSLKEFLFYYQIPFMEKDIEDNVNYTKELEELNIDAVPFTIINTETIKSQYLGFSEELKSKLIEFTTH